jgi:elongation factor 1-beta
MAKVVVTLKIMPASPEVNLEELENKINEKIDSFAGECEKKTTIEPIAFGLKALNILFVMDEAKGSTDFLETQISEFEEINSVEVTDVRRAIG